MKNTQTFSNKMVDLTGMQDYERITAEFNRLTKDYYAKEKNPVQRFRTLRQIRIRLASAKKVYEVAGKESEYIIRLLKNEEEIVLMFASQAKGSDLSPTENRALRLNWSGKQIDLVEIVYGLYVGRCINGGRCGSGDCSRFRAIVRCQIAAYLQPTVGYPEPVKTDGPRF